MTPLGSPVVPEVNSSLATCSGVMASKAASTAGPATADSSDANGVAALPSARVATNSACGNASRAAAP